MLRRDPGQSVSFRDSSNRGGLFSSRGPIFLATMLTMMLVGAPRVGVRPKSGHYGNTNISVADHRRNGRGCDWYLSGGVGHAAVGDGDGTDNRRIR